MKKLLHLFKISCTILLLSNDLQAQIINTYTYTGAAQIFTVPPCVSTVTLEVWGAQGGANWISNVNYGGYAKGVFPVTNGQVLYIYVGQQPNGTTGGWNGGGNGESLGQGGGGGTDIRTGGNALSNRILVAGGGGGAGYWSNLHVVGGVGGGLSGGDGYRNTTVDAGGQGGTQTGSGLGTCVTLNNSAVSGGFGFGGSPSGCGCEGYGGGGGWYGGAGSGNCRGGGGGSGYIHTSASGTVFTSGIQLGHGKAVLSYNTNGSGVSVTPSVATLCSGSSLTLAAGGVVTYTWFAPNTSNASSIIVIPTSNTNYTVQGTNSLGCISTAVIPVTVSNGLPVLSISNSAGSASICMGTQATLTANGALSYTWSPAVTNGIGFLPQATTSYTVQGENGCGISTAVTTITVAPLPINAIASSATVCAMNSVTLTSGGANTYTWSTTQQGVSAITAPSITSVYTVTGQIGACFGTGTVQVYVNPNPTLSIIGSHASICAGDVLGLTVSGAQTYTWTQSFLSGTSVTVSPVTTTVYAVSGSNQHSCTGSASYLIFVDPLPVVNITASKTLVCSGSPSTLTASGNSNTYLWTHGGTAPVTTVNPVSTTVYTVTGFNSQCSNKKTFEVAVFHPTFTVTNDTAVCEGGSVLLTASGGINIFWQGEPAGSSVLANPSSAKIYTAHATVASSNNYVSCPSTQTVFVDIYSKPAITVTAPRAQICKGEKAVVTASGGVSYSWSNNLSGQSLTLSPLSDANLTVTGTDDFNCTNTATIVVRVSTCPGFADNTRDLETGFYVYPNPNQGCFSVQSDFTTTVHLSTELGQSLGQYNLSELNSYKIDISGLSAGLYFITVEHEGVKLRRKVLIQ